MRSRPRLREPSNLRRPMAASSSSTTIGGKRSILARGFVHLGQGDLVGADIAAIKAAGIRLGISTHSVDRARHRAWRRARLCRARSDLCDEAQNDALGAARFATASPNGGRRSIARWSPSAASRLSVLPDVLAAGASSAAVVTDIVMSEDPEQRTRAMDRRYRPLAELIHRLSTVLTPLTEGRLLWNIVGHAFGRRGLDGFLGFSLDPAVPMSEAVRRVASAEIDTAYAALASPPERHKGVHDSRKCLKRLRSLLVLIRPGLPEPVFTSLTERLRTIARGLAPARDAAALLDAVDKFAKAEGEGEATPIPALRAWLQERRQAAKRSLDGSTASDAMRGLFALRPAMANLAVYPDDFSPIAKGLRDSAIAAAAKPLPRPLPPATTRISMSGARRCSIIGAICSCSRPAGRRSFPRGWRRRARCRKFSATITTSPCSASSSQRPP